MIQQNKQEIVDGAYAEIAVQYPSFTNPDPVKCKRDIEFFIDAVSLDIAQGGGNVYSRKFVEQYFTNATTLLPNGLQGEIDQSNVAFVKARDLMRSAITNQLTIKDTSVTAGPANYNGTGGNIANTNTGACADVQLAIEEKVYRLPTIGK